MLEIELCDEKDWSDNLYTIGISQMDKSLSIYLEDIDSFEKAIKDKEYFNKCAEEEISLCQDIDCDDAVKDWNFFKNNFDNLFEMADYVRLSFGRIDELEFLRKNKILKNKKVVLTGFYSLDDIEQIEKLEKKYNEFDNIYVQLTGNIDYVSLDDCKKTINKINEIVNSVKTLNLSPMENVMYVYDLVRNREYKEEEKEKGENSTKSRDLSKVLFGDKIVCVGFSKLYSFILRKLGIEIYINELEHTFDETSGHMRNIAHIVDPKYNIDGVYYFDSTWDSKIKGKSYLYKYKYFAKTKDQIEEENIRNNLIDEMIKTSMADLFESVSDIIYSDDQDALIEYIKTINYVSTMAIGKRIIDLSSILINYSKFDKDKFLDKFEECINYFCKDISAEKMLEILFNVRKIEYYINPEYYPFELIDLANIAYNSGWTFEDLSCLNNDEKFLYTIFGGSANIFVKQFKDYESKKNLEKEIAQVKLTRTLRNALDKKTHVE
ncbi:MAG: hypothetical protein E7158_05465 [Firmicutes bacterium]|nr:hypothetical protein [Bacillota bacterium]